MTILDNIHPTILKIVIAASVAIGVLAGFGTWQYLLAGTPPARALAPGTTEVATTHKALNEASKVLQGLDKKGDVPGATGMLDSVNYLLRNIDTAPFQSEAMRNCKLAAAHLANGVLSVSQGSTWWTQDRFENALADCS